MKKFVSLTMLVVILAGCATESGQGAAGGVVGGAALGALAGQLIGRNTTSTLIGAAAGGAIGAAIGYNFGKKLEDRKAALIGRENDLNARLRYARNVNSDLQAYNTQLEKDINNLNSKVAQLEVRKQQNQISGSELARERENLNKQTSAANNNLVLVQSEFSDLKNFQSQKRSASLDSEITKLEASLGRLRYNTSALASISQRI